MDFHGRTKDDGVEHEGMHAHGHKLELGSGQFIPGFEDQLIGKKAGEKVEVEVTFPEQYGAKELAGREAIFDVNIHEIHEPAEAEIDDEFAKAMGYDDLKALREAVKYQLTSDYAQQTRLKMKRQLLDLLDDGHDFAIPEAMAKAELEAITAQIEQERKADADSEELTKDEKEELEAISERRVRLGLVIAEIGTVNNIKVSDQELQRSVISEAQKFPGQEKMIFDYYQQNPQALENLRAPLFEDKVVDFIFEKSVITEKEVSVDELMKEEDEDTSSAKSKKKPAKKTEAKKTAKKAAKKKSA
jgi:trigger factor